MRKLVLAFAIAGSVACKPSDSKIEGHWRGTHAEGVEAATLGAANAFATKTEITAHGNTITVSLPGGKPQHDTFVVDSENATTIVLHTGKDGPANKETFSFSDEDTMVWRVGEGRSIAFQRLKE